MNLLSNIKKVFCRKVKTSLVYNTLPLLPYTLSLILAAMLPSCSEDLDVSGGINEIPEGQLRIDIAIPDPIRVNTRAEESDIKNLEVFIFSKDQSTFYQHLSYDGANLNNGSVGIALNGAARNSEITIYAVANDETCKDIITAEGLKKHVLTSLEPEKQGLPMLGFQSVNTANDNNATVSLYRAVSKISARSSVANVSVSDLKIYGYSEEAYLGAYHNEEDYIIKKTPKATGKEKCIGTQPVAETNAPFTFTFPSEGMDMTFDSYDRVESATYGVFIIMAVERNEETQYYRINLRKEDENGELEFIDMLPNHHYNVEITGFLTDGYSSYDEAYDHPEADQFVTYKIHDHAEEVRSMVTDGYNELGVTPEITLNSLSDKKTIVVKVFSPDKSVGVTVNDIEVTAPEWLSVTLNPENDGKHEYSGDYDATWDKDNPGVQYEFLVQIAGGARDYEDLTGEITFTWSGLSRTVKVNFEAALLLHEACAVTLNITDTDTPESWSIKDYWTFITAAGKNKTTKESTSSGEDATPQLFGIKPENMVGSKKRMNGFHFPMPYGNSHSSKPWTYEYTVDFSPLLEQTDIKGKTIQNIAINITSTDENLKTNDLIIWEYTSGNSGTLKFDQSKLSDPYEYLGGTITYTIQYADDSSSEVTASLYHTGFFHYEGDSKYASDADKGYYYYEVLPMADSHWLDRNIGAKANTSYIDTEDASAESGREATGKHYTIIDEPGLLDLPEFDFNMIPPGYHIPNSTEWDDLRLNKNFITQTVTVNSTLYMSTYYRTNNSKIGNVYFQKARFCNSKNIYKNQDKYTERATAGDAGAGYYWSVTEAPAMEKEQMGNWLRALYLNGSSSTFNNASVTDHRMPIRCIAGTYDEQKNAAENYISFNVHEATHVFLYHEETLTPLYTFPGRAIGSTDSAEKWQHFYCSTTQDPSDLLMVFVKLQEDGKVLIRKKSGDSFSSTQEFDKVDLKNEGWHVDKGLGKYYDFCEVGQDRDNCVFIALSEPTDCNTGNNSGSGDSGTGNIKKGAYETDRGSWDGNRPQAPEIIIWEGNQNLSWNDNRVSDNSYWTKLQPGSKLRIYGYQTNSENMISLRRTWQGWPGLLGSSQDYFQYNGIDGYVEIELTQEILDEIINNGFLITGTGFNMRYVTILPNGELLGGGDSGSNPPQLEEGDFHYQDSNPEGSEPGWNADQGFTQLSSNNYNWNEVKSATLYVSFIQKESPQIRICTMSNNLLTDYTPWGGNLPSDSTTITLDLDPYLEQIRAEGGLSICGQNYKITEVILIIN